MKINFVKNLSMSGATKWVIYIHCSVVKNMNPAPPDCKSAPLTIRPRLQYSELSLTVISPPPPTPPVGVSPNKKYTVESKEVGLTGNRKPD